MTVDNGGRSYPGATVVPGRRVTVPDDAADSVSPFWSRFARSWPAET